jgi:hypothetical protein
MARVRALAGAALVSLTILPPVSAAARPALQLVATHPVRVHGTHFRARETVHVSVRADGAFSRVQVVTNRRGAFSATVRISASSCTPLTVTALGSSGDHVATTRRVLCAVR